MSTFLFWVNLGAVSVFSSSCFDWSLTLLLLPRLLRLLNCTLFFEVVVTVHSFWQPMLWRCDRGQTLPFSSWDVLRASPKLFLRLRLFSFGDLGRVSGSCHHIEKISSHNKTAASKVIIAETLFHNPKGILTRNWQVLNYKLNSKQLQVNRLFALSNIKSLAIESNTTKMILILVTYLLKLSLRRRWLVIEIRYWICFDHQGLPELLDGCFLLFLNVSWK